MPIYLTGALILAFVSLYDDFKGASRLLRFLTHLFVALLVVISLGNPLASLGLTEWLEVSIAVFWVVALTNIYNFMDGIDGLAGGQTVVMALFLFLVSQVMGLSCIAILALLLAASASGFLIYNWAPAQVFMGDVGSVFVGYSFAVWTLIIASLGHDLIWTAFLPLVPFVFDASFTLVVRLSRRENVLRPHRSHVYQRLVSQGYSHRLVSGVYYGLAIVLAVFGSAQLGLVYVPSAFLWVVVIAVPGVLLSWVFYAERSA